MNPEVNPNHPIQNSFLELLNPNLTATPKLGKVKQSMQSRNQTVPTTINPSKDINNIHSSHYTANLNKPIQTANHPLHIVFIKPFALQPNNEVTTQTLIINTLAPEVSGRLDMSKKRTHNLESKLGSDPYTRPEVAGSNPAPLTEVNSLRANGTPRSLATQLLETLSQPCTIQVAVRFSFFDRFLTARLSLRIVFWKISFSLVRISTDSASFSLSARKFSTSP